MKKTTHQWAHWQVSILQTCANLVSAEEWSSFNEYLGSLINLTTAPGRAAAYQEKSP